MVIITRLRGGGSVSKAFKVRFILLYVDSEAKGSPESEVSYFKKNLIKIKKMLKPHENNSSYDFLKNHDFLAIRAKT